MKWKTGERKRKKKRKNSEDTYKFISSSFSLLPLKSTSYIECGYAIFKHCFCLQYKICVTQITMMLEIFLGTNERGEEVSWKPKEEKNPHFLVVGTSGSGKTETLRAIVHEFSKIKIPVMIKIG